VVVINVSTIRTDALVLMPNHNDVLHIPLPDFSLEIAKNLQGSLKALLTASNHRTSGDTIRHGRLFEIQKPDEEAEVEHILAQLWLLIVKPVLDGLNLKVNSLSS
jgi:hypothetical protein